MMIRVKTTHVETIGIFLLVFSVVFSFFFSMGFNTDYSVCDFLYYMHLVDEGNYAREPMCAGTLFLFKPLNYLFGNTYWLWNRFLWVVNMFTISIPYLFLLNIEQKKKYAFIFALAILLFGSVRCGCEPPRLVLLFSVTAVSLYLLYIKSKDSRYVIAISLLLALIAFCRFPSLFVYPLFVIAFMFSSKKIKDVAIIFFLPIVLFCLLVSLTNGNFIQYVNDLRNCFTHVSNTSQSHGISAIFMAEVDSVLELLRFSCKVLFFFLLMLWKKKGKKWCLLSLIISLYVLSNMWHHYNQRWACAIVVVTGIFYIWENKSSLKSIVVTSLIVFVPMLSSVGSDYGFGYDYVAIAFLPYLAINMKSIDNVDNNLSLQGFQVPFKRGVLYPVFLIAVMTVWGAMFAQRTKILYVEFTKHGELSVVNGGKLSPNLNHVYFNDKKLSRYKEIEKDYLCYSQQGKDVVFWGMDAHLMSFANDKWPITRLWKVSSVEGDNAAMYDLKDYVQKHKPIVIDMEEDNNTFQMLTSLGYHRTPKQTYSIYEVF